MCDAATKPGSARQRGFVAADWQVCKCGGPPAYTHTHTGSHACSPDRETRVVGRTPAWKSDKRAHYDANWQIIALDGLRLRPVDHAPRSRDTH